MADRVGTLPRRDLTVWPSAICGDSRLGVAAPTSRVAVECGAEIGQLHRHVSSIEEAKRFGNIIVAVSLYVKAV